MGDGRGYLVLGEIIRERTKKKKSWGRLQASSGREREKKKNRV